MTSERLTWTQRVIVCLVVAPMALWLYLKDQAAPTNDPEQDGE